MIKLFQHQKEFMLSDARHTGLVAGIGSGKSYVGSLKTVAKKLAYPNIDVAYYLPTYSLIKDIAVPRFKELFDDHNVGYTYNKSDKDFATPYGRIILRSMDNPDYIVGYEVGYSLIDEADTLPLDKMKEVFVKILGRNRKVLSDGKVNSTDFIGSPEGFQFLHWFFVKVKTDSKLLIKGKTTANTTLPQSFIDGLVEGYSEEEVRAYMGGEFCNLTSGTVFHAFDRKEHHTDREIDSRDILHVGLDFNITNMSAVVHVIDGGVIKAVDEFVKIYDTEQMCQMLNERYRNRIIIYPDASGHARKTSGGSDFQILKSHGFKILSPSKNPLVRDRVNYVNQAFTRGGYLVNTDRCIDYTEALEQLSYKAGAPDKTSGFDHVCDAGSYFVSYKRKNKRARIIV